MMGLLLTEKEMRKRDIEDLKNCGINTAVHEVHQLFGPDHPVTREIIKMRKELAMLRKHTDFEDRKYIGKIKRLGVYATEENSKA